MSIVDKISPVDTLFVPHVGGRLPNDFFNICITIPIGHMTCVTFAFYIHFNAFNTWVYLIPVNMSHLGFSHIPKHVVYCIHKICSVVCIISRGDYTVKENGLSDCRHHRQGSLV